MRTERAGKKRRNQIGEFVKFLLIFAPLVRHFFWGGVRVCHPSLQFQVPRLCLLRPSSMPSSTMKKVTDGPRPCILNSLERLAIKFFPPLRCMHPTHALQLNRYGSIPMDIKKADPANVQVLTDADVADFAPPASYDFRQSVRWPQFSVGHLKRFPVSAVPSHL